MNWLVFCSKDSIAALEPRALSALVMSVQQNNDYALQFSMEINTLWTGDADLRFYITTVQDG